MNYAEIKYPDVANGPGIRVSLFVSGCTTKCKNCFNPEAQDFEYGEPFTKEVAHIIIDELNHAHVTGLSILGGEPLHPYNIETVANFIKDVKTIHPDISIWIWTGYLFENLMRTNDYPEKTTFEQMVNLVDTIVDGPFLEEKKDLKLRFRGSSNQRIINIPATLQKYHNTKEIVLREEFY